MGIIVFNSIGTIHSPFSDIEGMPVQPSAAKGVKGHIEIDDDLVEGLHDLSGFSHIYLLYHLHLSESYKLKVTPFLDDQQRGVFSTRAPKRPNPIGLSVVKITNVKSNIIKIENVDIVDGTPLLDIKPYIPDMEGVDECKIGWLSKYKKDFKSKKSDNRFQ